MLLRCCWVPRALGCSLAEGAVSTPNNRVRYARSRVYRHLWYLLGRVTLTLIGPRAAAAPLRRRRVRVGCGTWTEWYDCMAPRPRNENEIGLHSDKESRGVWLSLRFSECFPRRYLDAPLEPCPLDFSDRSALRAAALAPLHSLPHSHSRLRARLPARRAARAPESCSARRPIGRHH